MEREVKFGGILKVQSLQRNRPRANKDALILAAFPQKPTFYLDADFIKIYACTFLEFGLKGATLVEAQGGKISICFMNFLCPNGISSFLNKRETTA